MGEKVKVFNTFQYHHVPDLTIEFVNGILDFRAEGCVIDFDKIFCDYSLNLLLELFGNALVAFGESDHWEFSVLFYILYIIDEINSSPLFF